MNTCNHLVLLLILSACHADKSSPSGGVQASDTGEDSAGDAGSGDGGATDTGEPCDTQVFYTDADGDGFGDAPVEACEQPEGTATVDGDCDDDNSARHPDATEVCDGADDNCDGDVDEGLLSDYYPDTDGDGYGAGEPIQACAPTTGYAPNADDCDDARADWNVGEWDCLSCTVDEDAGTWPDLEIDADTGARVICNTDQLIGLSGDVTAWADDYIIKADLDMTGLALTSTIGTSSTPFTGDLQGANKTITGLNLVAENHYLGLFGSADGSTIENLTLSDVWVEARYKTGGLVGYGVDLTVSNVSVDGTVSGTYPVGGVIGYLDGGTLTDLSFTGEMIGGNQRGGGILGEGYSFALNGCAVDVDMTSGLYTGGAVGIAQDFEVRDCVVDARIATYDSAPTNNAGLIGASLTGSGLVEDCTIAVEIDCPDGQHLGGVIGANYATVTVDRVDATGAISGYRRCGGAVAHDDVGGVYTDVHVDVDVACGSRTGGFGGRMSDVVATDCSASGDVTSVLGDAEYVAEYGGFGGLVSEGSFTRVTASGDVSVEHGQYVGGLMGASSGALSECSATGDVSTTGALYYAGGLVGMHGGADVTNCTASGHVTAPELLGVGGLMGISGGAISGSSASGDVTGADSTGGLVGGSAASISDCSATGAVVSSGQRVGGLAGYSTANTDDSFATGPVDGDDVVGGLVGRLYSGGTIARSYATGAVRSNGEAGGLASLVWTSDVSDSYATGDVTGTSRVGGLVGRAYTGAISSSYATGLVTGDDDVGGLVGHGTQGSTIDDSFATGDAIGNTDVHAFLGVGGTSTNCWVADTSVATVDDDCQTAPPADFELSSSAPLDTWDFSAVWVTVVGDLPQLQ